MSNIRIMGVLRAGIPMPPAFINFQYTVMDKTHRISSFDTPSDYILSKMALTFDTKEQWLILAAVACYI